MIIIKDEQYLSQLFNILKYIAKDKKSAALYFERKLNKKIIFLKDNPAQYRKSIYFDDEHYRDLIYQGYTIIYKIEKEKILILEIFKWIDR